MAGKYRNLYYGLCKYCFSLLPDILYHNLLGYIMHKRFGVKYHWMNIRKPKTFSEKLQWAKSHGNIPLKNKLADKYDVRIYIEKTIGAQYLVKLIQLNHNGDLAIDNVESIDFDLLPSQFVLKMTKGSGFNIICHDKSHLNVENTKATLRKWLKINNYYLSRQKEYIGGNKLICEEMLEYNITDYKFFCFDGEPKYVELYIDRLGNHKKVFYDMDWNKALFITGGDSMEYSAPKPAKFDEMVKVAKTLSKGFNFVRIDLYEHDNRVFFGEMTFAPAGGYTPITPHEWDYRLGGMIQIDN